MANDGEFINSFVMSKMTTKVKEAHGKKTIRGQDIKQDSNVADVSGV